MKTPAHSLCFVDIPRNYSAYEQAKVVIISAGHEATTSYGKGTARGPSAIIAASQYVELYDEVLDSNPYEVGIHTLPPLDLDNCSHEEVHNRICEAVASVLRDGKFPIVLGGEHSISSGVVKAFGKEVTVLQVDAHADLRHEYEGSIWSHASVMSRIVDAGNPTVGVGIRSLTSGEALLIRERKRPTWYAHQLRGNWIEEIMAALKGDVYLTFDVDAWDPAIMSSTGTPEPGGMSWYQTMELMEALFQKCRVVGMDVVELAPIAGTHAPDFMTAKFIYRSIGLLQKYQ